MSASAGQPWQPGACGRVAVLLVWSLDAGDFRFAHGLPVRLEGREDDGRWLGVVLPHKEDGRAAWAKAGERLALADGDLRRE